MSRARDVADVQDNLGGAVPPYVAGKNIVINGGFDIFQRTSFSTTGVGYGIDLWQQTSSGGGSVSMTQQTTGVPLGSRYCARITAGATAGYGNQNHFIETANCASLWGKTVTLSLKLRRSSSFATSLAVGLQKSSTVDAGVGATWVSVGSETIANASLPTGATSSDWYTVKITAFIPNDGTANSLRVSLSQAAVMTSAYWEMAQVQLELGSVATPFARAGGTIQGELAACQRYYIRVGGDTVANPIALGMSDSTTSGVFLFINPVIMRAAPTSIEFSTLAITDYANYTTNISTLTLSSANKNISRLNAGGGTGITSNRAVALLGNGAGNYFGISAEL
jgi:hypothetical protein